MARRHLASPRSAFGFAILAPGDHALAMEQDSLPDPVGSALPSGFARFLAFLAILVAGASGGLIGFGIADIQCGGDCSVLAGVAGVLGAVLAASGVAIIAVLTLRAMGEWRAGGQRQR